MIKDANQIVGYIYVPNKQETFAAVKTSKNYSPDDTTELFASARIGDTIIKKDKAPPYLVVDHKLHTIIVTKWPGALYKVEVLNPEEEREINNGLVENVRYTRTFGVRIIEEVPVAALFGNNGEQVKRIIDLVRSVTEEQVSQLAEYDAKQNGKTYSKAWKNWVLLTDSKASGSYERVIAVHPKNQERISPIGQGLAVISTIYYQTVRELTQDEALDIDDEGEISFKPKWSRAAVHFLHAAMSYEADNLLTQKEKEDLRKPIVETFEL